MARQIIWRVILFTRTLRTPDAAQCAELAEWPLSRGS
jgi:hypothetical protein